MFVVLGLMQQPLINGLPSFDIIKHIGFASYLTFIRKGKGPNNFEFYLFSLPDIRYSLYLHIGCNNNAKLSVWKISKRQLKMIFWKFFRANGQKEGRWACGRLKSTGKTCLM